VVEQEMAVITNTVLYDTMGKMKPPIEAKKADKTEVLIQKIVESMRTREVAPSPAGAVLQGSLVKEEPADDAAVMHTEKKQRVEGLDAVAIADASEGPSRYSSPPAKLATGAAVSAGAHAKQPAIAGDLRAICSQHQPQSWTSDIMEGLSGSSDSPANHAGDEEEDEGQQGSVVQHKPVHGSLLAHVQKKRKAEFDSDSSEAAATAIMKTPMEDATKIASRESITAVKQDSNVALTAAPNPSNFNAVEQGVVGGSSVISSTYFERYASTASGTPGSQHRAGVFKAQVPIQNIVEQEVAPSLAGAALQGSVIKQEPADDAAVMHTEKKQRVEGLDAVAIADASEGSSGDSSTPANLATDAAGSAGAHAKQPTSPGDFGEIGSHQPRSRRLDVMEGSSGSSDSPASHATAEGVLEAGTVGEWGRLEFKNGTVVPLNIPVGARYMIGHPQAKGLDSACDYEAVDSWKNSNGLVVISALYLTVHMICYCYQGF